jgi:hypothetical protein
MHADEHPSRMPTRPVVPMRGTGHRRHGQLRQMRVPRPVVPPKGKPPAPRQLNRRPLLRMPRKGVNHSGSNDLGAHGAGSDGIRPVPVCRPARLARRSVHTARLLPRVIAVRARYSEIRFECYPATLARQPDNTYTTQKCTLPLSGSRAKAREPRKEPPLTTRTERTDAHGDSIVY